MNFNKTLNSQREKIYKKGNLLNKLHQKYSQKLK